MRLFFAIMALCVLAFSPSFASSPREGGGGCSFDFNTGKMSCFICEPDELLIGCYPDIARLPKRSYDRDCDLSLETWWGRTMLAYGCPHLKEEFYLGGAFRLRAFEALLAVNNRMNRREVVDEIDRLFAKPGLALNACRLFSLLPWPWGQESRGGTDQGASAADRPSAPLMTPPVIGGKFTATFRTLVDTQALGRVELSFEPYSSGPGFVIRSGAVFVRSADNCEPL